MKRFLIIQTAFIGDTILATAVVEHLHKNLRDNQIDVLVRAGNESLFQGHPFIRKIYVWDKRKGKYRNLIRLILSIRKERYDGIVNLQRHTASALVTVLSAAKKTSGFDSSFLSHFFSFKFKHRLGKKNESDFMHEVDRCIELTSPWLAPLKIRPALYPSPDDYEAVVKYASKPYITISPSSVWFTKQTPVAVWRELIKSLPNRQFYLLGGPTDISLCQELAKEHSHVHVLAGKLSLLQSAALMKHAEMNYTNDSAPLHLCSAMNAPVTAVFCSTIPEFGFGPLSDFSRVVQSSAELACKPCGVHGKSLCPKQHFDCGKIQVSELLTQNK